MAASGPGLTAATAGGSGLQVLEQRVYQQEQVILELQSQVWQVR